MRSIHKEHASSCIPVFKTPWHLTGHIRVCLCNTPYLLQVVFSPLIHQFLIRRLLDLVARERNGEVIDRYVPAASQCEEIVPFVFLQCMPVSSSEQSTACLCSVTRNGVGTGMANMASRLGDPLQMALKTALNSMISKHQRTVRSRLCTRAVETWVFCDGLFSFVSDDCIVFYVALRYAVKTACSMLVSIGINSRKVYVEHFQVPFLDESSKFYRVSQGFVLLFPSGMSSCCCCLVVCIVRSILFPVARCAP